MATLIVKHKAALAAGVITTVVPTLAAGVSMNINVANDNASPVRFKCWVSANPDPDAPLQADVLEPNVLIDANDVLERGGIPMEAGERLVCLADQANVVVRAHGFKED